MLGHKNPGSLKAIGKGNILVKQFLTSGIRKNIGQDSRVRFKVYPPTSYKTASKSLIFLQLLVFQGQIERLDWMNSKIPSISEILRLDLIQTIIQLYCVVRVR